MFNRFKRMVGNQERIHAIDRSLSREGGIYKRIDENRELMELLQQRCPEFLIGNFWVRGWLESQDRFLLQLAHAAQTANHLAGCRFPRPWPEDQAETKRAQARPRTIWMDDEHWRKLQRLGQPWLETALDEATEGGTRTADYGLDKAGVGPLV